MGRTPSLHALYAGESTGPVRALHEYRKASITVSLAADAADALERLNEIDFDCVVYADDAGERDRLETVAIQDQGVPIVRYGDAESDDDVPGVVVDPSEPGDQALPEAVVDVVTEASQDGDRDAPEEIRHSHRHAPLWTTPSFVETVLDNLLDVFFVFTVDGGLVEWNTSLEAVTGRTADQLAGADPFEFIAPDHREQASTRLASVLTEGGATGEFDIVSVDGTRTPYEFVASLITDDGIPQYVCGIGRDVSELRQKQKELERKQAELDQVVEELRRSNAELEQFAYVASHDMKEPLRMVRNYLELLDRRYGDQLDDDADDFIEYAVDGARRLQALIDQLLTYSRIDREGDPFQAVDCQAVLNTVQRNLEVAIEETEARIETEPLPTVTGDRDQLVQLFQNLLSNAIKYNEGTPHVHVEATSEGDIWEFAVRDDGIGIPSDRIDHVFEAFYGDATGVEGIESTGIGLAICERIVERHGGDIRVESTPGEGSTFRFTLPDADTDQESETVSTSKIRDMDGSVVE